jgi:Reverse transcriptase (RNA-dependent DNA polymerase)
MEREHHIARTASEMRDSRVVVFDLKRFYPSIDVSKVKERFARRVELTSFTSSERDTAIQCVEELTSIKHEVGLPVGPPLSHMLANVFLREVDNRMCHRFPGCYVRYVDDIAIIVPRGEVESAQRFFEQVVAEEGLKVNTDKVDILTGDEWAARVRHREQGGEDSFGRLVSDLRRYLAHNTGDFSRVRDLFRANGFVLPFSRLRSVAASRPFRRFLKSLWSQSGGLLGRNIPRPTALLERANSLRREFRDQLRRISERPLPSGGMARRWAIQDFRYLLNRSLYLRPPEAREEILGLIPDCLELRPSRAVLEALVTGDASELTKYPGPTVSAFCGLWMETTEERPRFTWSSVPAREERDGAIVLALCGLCTPPNEWTNQLRERSSQVMVELSARLRPTCRSFDDFSYIDEMESLFLRPNIDVGHLLTSRFDEGEDVVLPALRLGGSQYMS